MIRKINFGGGACIEKIRKRERFNDAGQRELRWKR